MNFYLGRYLGVILVFILSIAMSKFVPKIFIYSSFLAIFFIKFIYININIKEKIRYSFYFFYLSMLTVLIMKPSWLGIVYVVGILMFYVHVSGGVYIHNKLLILCGYLLVGMSLFPIYNIDGRLEGFWGDVNSNAVVAYFISSIILLKIKQQDLKGGGWILLLLLLFLNIVVILMSGSRIAILALALNFLFLFFRKFKFSIALFIFIIYNFLFISYVYFFSESGISFMGRNVYDSGRIDIYRYAIDYYMQYGFSGFSSQEGIFGFLGIGSAHSTPLRILVEFGIFPLTGYIIIVISMIYYSKYDYSRILIVNSYLLCLFWSSMPFGISAISAMIFIFYFIDLNVRNIKP